jgi:small-conductance mechanosensitive channel
MSTDHRENTLACSQSCELLFDSLFFAVVPSRAARWIKNKMGSEAPRRHWLLQCFFVAAVFTISGSAHAQPATPSTVAAEHPAPASPTVTEPAPIPLAEVATEAEEASARVRDIQTALSSDRLTNVAAQQLPVITREIDARLRETRKIVAQKASLEILAGLESEWRRVRNNLSDWTRDLTRRVTQLERDRAQLEELAKTWEQTLESANKETAPADIIQRIEGVIAEIEQARSAIELQRAQTLTLQNRVALQDGRTTDALELIRQAHEDILNRLFVKDSAPVWSGAAHSRTPQDYEQESRSSLFTQLAGLSVYAERQAGRISVHIALIVGLVAALYWVRRQARRHAKEEPAFAQAARVFEMPIAVAPMLSFLASRWIYPQAPRLLWAVLGAAALIPSVIVLRRRIERDLDPVLYALIVFYFIDQFRVVAAAVQFLPRLLFLAEMFGAALFLIWLIRSLGCAPRSTPERERQRRKIDVAAWFALAVSAMSFAANFAGYVTLANFLGNALLSSAYLAVMLSAVVEVLDGLVMLALRLRPLALFSTVGRHRLLLHHRMRHALQWLAALLWVLFVLDRFLLRERLFGTIYEILTAELTVGALRISLGDVLAFAITVWAAVLVSRFVRFLLEEEVYPHVNLTRGLPYAISTTLHYAILLIGLFAAVAALGLDMTKVTILAGAFSVGVGLGLQNIFNNFVSGLILLFERPVNVGDVVQIDDASGVIERIGIRASVIRTTNGAEVIVPNGKLISDRVINWTFSGRQRSIELPIAVAQDADPRHVIRLLERTAAEHPLVTRDPPPEALVVKLGPESLSFELRAWTDRVERWTHVRSELAIAISAALAAEHIAIR